MPSTIAAIWASQPAILDGKSFRQTIHLAGDGRLRDGNTTSAELREWLALVPLSRLRLCVEECLADTFDESALALQDCTNEIGARLGYRVTPGRYRGSRGVNGNDGVWTAQDGHALLVEVKTTDAYRINLDTIAGYREQLIAEGTLKSQDSSILIAVGRQDTGDLEAQIRGSRHAWDIRLISLDALLHLAEVKDELTDAATSSKINQLLRPVEYTRVDGIVDLLFAAKTDIQANEPASPPVDIGGVNPALETPATNLEQAREVAVRRIGDKLGCAFARRGRALRDASDGSLRLVCLASQRYERSDGSSTYWYGFTPAQKDFLDGVAQGWVGLVCADSGTIYLIQWTEFQTWLPDFLTTPPEPQEGQGIRHWHVYFRPDATRIDLIRSGGGAMVDLSQYALGA